MLDLISNNFNISPDDFNTNIAKNKYTEYEDTFSNILNKAERNFYKDRNEKTKIDNVIDDNDKISSYNKDEKPIEDTDKIEENNIDKSNTDETNIDEEIKKEKNINIDNNIIDLIELEKNSEITTEEVTTIDITSLIEKINEIIKQIELASEENSPNMEINNIFSILHDIKTLMENAINKNISNDTNLNVGLEIKNKINLLIENLHNNALENTNIIESIKNLSNKIESVISDNSKLVSISENASTDSADFSVDIQKAKEDNNKNLDKGDKSETNFSKSTETISNEKTTELTIVKSKDNVVDIMDKPLNSDISNMAKTSSTDTNSTIDIINKFQDMLSRIVEKAKLTLNDGKTDMIIALKPEHLGNVRIKMTMEGDNFYGKVFVDNAEVKDIFTKNLDTIITSLKELNISIEGFDVTLNQNSDGQQFFNDDTSNTFDINGSNSIEVDSSQIENTLEIATVLYPERKLNIVI